MKEYTTEDFYSNINKLYKLIVISLEKEQTKNSEKYINYFFEVMVKYYQKSSKVIKSNQSFEFLDSVTSEVNINKLGLDRSGIRFPNRQIEPVFGDFFMSRVLGLIALNIKSSRFDVFYFCLSRFKDSIRILLKNQETYESASILLSQFKFIADKIYSNHDQLSKYEKSWFLGETYNWFIEMYSSDIKSLDELSLLEKEITYILRYYIDNNRVDIFKQFLLRLSSGIFNFGYEKERMLNKFQPQGFPNNFKFIEFVRKMKISTREFKTLYEFQNHLEKIDAEIDTEVSLLITDQQDLATFKDAIRELLFGEFKITYLKLILIKAIIYSFFKKNYTFFQVYLNYHQPIDSDAHWSNKNFGIDSINELFRLLADGENLTIRDHSFWIDHHGFRIYLNTFVAYYILKFKEADLVSVIESITDYSYCFSVEQFLLDIKGKNNLHDLAQIINGVEINEFNDRIDRLISITSDRKAQITKRNIISNEVDKGFVDEFKSHFIEQFVKMATFRSLFKVFDSFTPSDEYSDIKGMGINVLLPKEAFLKESTAMYFNMATPYANQMAENENISILYSLQRACKSVHYSKIQFEKFLSDNIDKYDLLISKGHYLTSSDFQTLKVEESWAFESELKSIPDYIGRIEKKINVFNVNFPSKEGFILLDSKFLGILKQFRPPEIVDSENLDVFAFSLIDFKNDSDSFKKHVESGINEDKLLESVWVRIYEKFQFEISEDFNGLHIEIVG